MKSKFFKLFITAAFIFSAGFASAQELGPQWGENATQEERHQSALIFNYYRDAYNSQRYDDALNYLPHLLENSPRGAQNIYVYAINIYRNKIMRSTDLSEKNMFVDSLLELYDLRMEYFGDVERYGRPYILINKAKDYLSFRPTDREGVLGYFSEAIDANAAEPDADFINLYFNELTNDYLAESIETDDYMAEYEKLAAMMDMITDPAAAEAKNTFDSLFISSGAADCNNIESIYKGRIEANPDDVDVLSKAFGMLNRGNCNTPFFLEVAQRYFALQPNANTARAIAKAYERNGDARRATEFLKAALDNETNQESKASLAIEISGMELNANNSRSAATYANMARQFNPDNGHAYMLLAQAYVQGAADCETFDQQTVYWLAYDLLSSARRVVANSPDDLKRVDDMMRSFRNYFPSQEELFFRGYTQDGAAYDVKCGWITGRTTVKRNNN